MAKTPKSPRSGEDGLLGLTLPSIINGDAPPMEPLAGPPIATPRAAEPGSAAGPVAPIDLQAPLNEPAAPKKAPITVPVDEAPGEVEDLIQVLPNEPTTMTMTEINQILVWGSDNDCSDIFVYSGFKVKGQRNGKLITLNRRRLETPEVMGLVGEISASAESSLLSGTDVDLTHHFSPARGRHYSFRVCATRCREVTGGNNAVEIVLRSIPYDIPTLAKQKVPQAIVRDGFPKDGIVLVTGPTGSGKSTLLAGMIKHLLITTDSRVLTYEAPPEFPLVAIPDIKGMISQCEIGTHIESFAAGVRNALRRKPDYILIGEARDRETIEMCIRAGETGHGVYTTLHTRGVLNAIDRMADEFPPDVRWGVKVKLIDAMRLIIHQRLVKTPDGKRTALREWLPFSEALRDQLIEGGPDNFNKTLFDALQRDGRPLHVDAEERYAEGLMFKKDLVAIKGGAI